MNMSFICYQIKKISAAKDHGKNYMKDRPLLACYLSRNGLHFCDTMFEHLIDNYGFITFGNTKELRKLIFIDF